VSTDQPPTASWTGLLWATVRQYTHLVWLALFVFNSLVGALAVATVAHLYVGEVPALAAAEAQVNRPLEATITHPIELLAYATVIPLAAVASLMKYISGRRS